MAFIEKSKAINNKIESNKAQNDLVRQVAKIWLYHHENIGEFLTGEEDFPEKDLLEKAATIQRFEYLLLSSELKK